MSHDISVVILAAGIFRGLVFVPGLLYSLKRKRIIMSIAFVLVLTQSMIFGLANGGIPTQEWLFTFAIVIGTPFAALMSVMIMSPPRDDERWTLR